MTKGTANSEVWPFAAAGVIIDIKEAPPPAGSEDVSCERKIYCTILAAQRTSIARLMTTITSTDPQRHRRIPTPLRRPTDRFFCEFVKI
jgi:hypothetical protein